MRKTPLMFSSILFIICAGHVFAEPRQERVTLMLSGQDCPSLQQTIAERLEQATGVTRVDFGVLPDHAMIDRVPSRLSPEDLASQVNSLAPTGANCLAEVMKSCITTDLATVLRSDAR